MTHRYTILDVFTATPLEGNPLAVVTNAAGLTDAAMQKIAAEFNLSETVFVFPPENPVHTARLRIFTPHEELPFAGHPTVGTAILLAAQRGKAETGDALVTLEQKVGPVRCGVTFHKGGGHTWFDAPKLPESIDHPSDKTKIAAALGLEPRDIGFENHIPSGFDAGAPFIFVPIHNIAAIAETRPQTNVWADVFGDVPVFLYTRETVAVARQFHARMFAPGFGIAEDPATGGAAVAMAGVIHRFDINLAGTHTTLIEQGFEMGRPSIIQLEIDIEGGEIAEIRIGGEAVLVATGTLSI